MQTEAPLRHSKPAPHKRPLRIRRKALLIIGILLVLVSLHWAWRTGRITLTPPDDIARYDGREVQVINVVDGDTLDLDLPDLRCGRDTTRVRLWGVDTPETKHPEIGTMYFGPEAAAKTRELTLDKIVTVRLEPVRPPRDLYDRLLAYIYLPDGRSLNEVLLGQGFAYADTRFDHVYRDRFIQLEKQAQTQQQGLWHGATAQQWPAWRQRREGMETN